ncbi:MAG: helix-turn-helix domain-containing protein [Alphaproteobacteria bacterium]
MTIGERIRAARNAAGLSQARLAERVGVSQPTVNNWEHGGHNPSRERVTRIAEAVGCTVGWLELGEPGTSAIRTGPLHGQSPAIVEVPPAGMLPRDVDVYGVAVGGLDGDFSFNGTVIDRVRRPPGLAAARRVFAIYVVGDSMSPRFEHGDLVFIHPDRPARPGDDVVVELHGRGDEPGQCYVKRLVRRTGSKIVLGQFNPRRDDIELPSSRMRHVYRILTAAELFGV